MGLFEFILILVIGVPIAKAVAGKISGRPAVPTRAMREALEQSEQRLEDTERRLAEAMDRIAEVEERLDFTERLLAQHKAREQLGP